MINLIIRHEFLFISFINYVLRVYKTFDFIFYNIILRFKIVNINCNHFNLILNNFNFSFQTLESLNLISIKENI